MKKALIIIFFLPVMAIAQKKDSTGTTAVNTAGTAAKAAPDMLAPGTITLPLAEWESVITALNNIGSRGVLVTLDPNIRANLINQYARLLSQPAEKPKK